MPVEVPKEIRIPVPQPYKVPIEIPHPYPVEVVKHVEIPIEKPEPVVVEKHVSFITMVIFYNLYVIFTRMDCTNIRVLEIHTLTYIFLLSVHFYTFNFEK